MSEQAVATICEEVIHYPSEDYPCLCGELVPDATGKVCVNCSHDVRKHHRVAANASN